MNNYLLAYRGGRMADSEEERTATMNAWRNWFGELGDSVVEIGNPLAASAEVNGGGSVADGAASGLSGYSVLKAESLDAASQLAKGCPVLSGGGSVDVYEAVPVM